MYAKVDSFTVAEQELAQIAKVFSHPARIAIVKLLAERQECIVGDIAQEFPFLSRTTVSQHLQELKQAGIIRGEIEGVKVCYCLDMPKLAYLKAQFEQFFGGVMKIDCNC
jgi:DNA-binding transcriptional ArsR family regulator